MNILIVLTSHDELGATGYPTGFWLGDLTVPYYAFLAAAADLTLASPRGGPAPIDPRSLATGHPLPNVEQFRSDPAARTLLSDTLRLEQVDGRDFDAAYFPGGHGALWDLATDAHCRSLITQLLAAGRPIALVGHSPAALLRALDPSGRPLIAGRHLTCYSNSEESADGLAAALPYSLQDEVIRLGAFYSKRPDGVAHVVCDRELITGQNAASAREAASRLIEGVRRTS